jgi:transcriptional/translational regulatory protein YebC/TACO1
MELVLEAGGEDLSQDGDQYEILTDPTAFAPVMEALQKAGIQTQSGEVSLVPLSYTPVTSKATASSVMKLVSETEDHDDVQAVYTNMDVDENVLKELEKA